VAAHIVAKLRPLIRDVVVLPSTETDIVLDIALLIERTAEDPLGEQLETLDDEFSDMLSFRLVGPLPPCSFATVQARFPEQGEIEQARLTLNLGEAVTLDDVKAAYRRAMLQYHPDLRAGVEARSGGDNDAAANVIAAYKILRLLLTPPDDLTPADRGTVYRLDGAGIDDHVLVSLHRQASLPLPGADPE
jgi:hypothetical protein